MAAKWSIVKLERACRRAFVQRGTLELKALNDSAARASWQINGPIDTEIDPLTSSYLGGMLHELFHNVLAKELAPFKDYTKDRKTGVISDDLMEIAVNAWEEALTEYVREDDRRLQWWRRAIDRKLTEKK